MKVILVKDVHNVGTAGDLADVADGYGRNYLIARGLAKLATDGEIRQAAQHRRREQKRAIREMTDAQAMAQRLEGVTLTFKAHAGEGTKLYGSITSSDIADQLTEKLGREFDRRKIHLDESLRQLGTHQVTIRLTHDLTPEITVVIERDEEPASD